MGLLFFIYTITNKNNTIFLFKKKSIKMETNEKKFKQIKISELSYQQIKIESARSGLKIYEFINELMNEYIKISNLNK